MQQIDKSRISLAVLCLLGLTSTAIAAPPTHKPSKANSTAAPATAKTPEAVLRRFLIALVTQDGKTMRATIVPVSDADFAYLMAGEAPPGGERIREKFAALPIKALKAGDAVALPDGRSIAFPAKGLGPDQTLLLPQGFPLPFLVQRVKGVWKVNAAPLIGARKSAAKINDNPLVGPPQK